MTFFDVLSMIGGLALFLYGMNALGDGLAKMSGGKLERILEKLTSNKFMAVVLGAGVTAVIQSSSATTVMVVGFVNSGIMKLSQVVGIIMGANIGTTITSWILSLTGIESGNFLMQLCKPTSFSPILAIIGVIMMSSAKKENRRDIGGILIGFAVLMFGMDMMSDAVAPLAEVEGFRNLMLMFSNPFLGMLAGALLTAAIQSSSASVGILQAFCKTGLITYGTAIPIIMGQNIGTCITAIISSIGANKNAKRAACVHLYFNLIGTMLFMVVFYGLNVFIDFAFLDDVSSLQGIAVVHSLFNVAATLVLLPFSNLLVKLAELTIRDSKENEKKNSIYSEDSVLDDRFLEKPSFAIQLCRSESIKMAELSRDAITLAMEIIKEYDEEKVERVIAMEQRIDKYEDDLGSYMVKLGGRELSQNDSNTLSIMLHCIGDFERISDHAVNIVESAQEMNKKKLHFSDEAMEELEVMTDAIRRIVKRATKVFSEFSNLERARKVEPLEQVIDRLAVEIKQRHIRRLTEGRCTIELGFILSDIATTLERVADHCSNVAVCVIQVTEKGLFGTHEYIEIIKTKNNAEFKAKFEKYLETYQLPYNNFDHASKEEE